MPLSLAVACLMPASEAYAQFAVNCSQHLHFDTVAACAGGGTIKVSAKSGKVARAGCAYVLGTPQRAVCTAKSFSTSGSIQVKVTAKTTNVSGPGVMQVKNFNIGTAAGGPTKTYLSATLTATPLTFGIGGDLIINGGQSIGSYSGSVVITVMYTP